MNWEKIGRWLEDGINQPLFHLSGTEVTLVSLVTFVLIVFSSLVISLLIQRALRKGIGHRFVKKEGAFATILRLIHYLILFIGLGIALQMIGINMTSLFAAGAVFAIAIGFAMQNIVQNFVSGIILLVERSIKPGDILEVDGVVVKVLDMGIRTTIVRTWKEEDIIIPNSELSQSMVKNFTKQDEKFRLGVVVGVTYGSDMKKVMEVLISTAKKMEWTLPDPPPSVLMQDFGSSSVDFGVYLAVDNPWKQRLFMSELRQAIWFALKENDITIAFPQVDIHFDPSVTEGMSRIAKAV